MEPDASISLAAHAKLNLALSVGPPEPPRGYHPIASWFAAVDLADTVRLERAEAEGSAFSVDWAADAPAPSPIDWPIEKDLGFRAHRALEAHVGRALPARVTIQKRIPVGGGLGGGSSDAAAVLAGLDRLFELDLDRAALIAISTTLGSDVAFFLDAERPPRQSIVRGFGERIDRIVGSSGGATAQAAVLVFPPFGCPTGEVYRAFDQRPGAALREGVVRELVSTAARRGRVPTERLFNDLAAPARDVQPRLAAVQDRLGALAHGPVHVTGSGSTLFCLAEEGVAGDVADAFRRAAPEVAVVVTRLI